MKYLQQSNLALIVAVIFFCKTMSDDKGTQTLYSPATSVHLSIAATPIPITAQATNEPSLLQRFLQFLIIVFSLPFDKYKAELHTDEQATLSTSLPATPVKSTPLLFKTPIRSMITPTASGMFTPKRPTFDMSTLEQQQRLLADEHRGILDKCLAEQRIYLEQQLECRFMELLEQQQSVMEQQLAEQRSMFEQRLAEQRIFMEQQFATQSTIIEQTKHKCTEQAMKQQHLSKQHQDVQQQQVQLLTKQLNDHIKACALQNNKHAPISKQQQQEAQQQARQVQSTFADHEKRLTALARRVHDNAKTSATQYKQCNASQQQMEQQITVYYDMLTRQHTQGQEHVMQLLQQKIFDLESVCKKPVATPSPSSTSWLLWCTTWASLVVAHALYPHLVQQ